jgi:hypothetical protein
MNIKYDYLCTSSPIVMFDYLTKKKIREFLGVQEATKILFGKINRDKSIYENLREHTKKVFLKDKTKVYFKYKEDAGNK